MEETAERLKSDDSSLDRNTNLNSFLRVPHGVFESVRSTFLTLLTEQFEANDAVMLMLLRLRCLDPEEDTAFH